MKPNKTAWHSAKMHAINLTKPDPPFRKSAENVCTDEKRTGGIHEDKIDSKWRIYPFRVGCEVQ